MSTEENKKIAQDVVDAINGGGWNEVANFFADDATIWVAGSLPGMSGTFTKEFMEGLNERLADAYPEGHRMTTLGMTAEGDRVAIEAEFYGMHVGGKLYNNFYHTLLVIRDGKIHEWREYMDTKHAAEIFLPDLA